METFSSALIAPKALEASRSARIGRVSVIQAGLGRAGGGSPARPFVRPLLEVELVDVRLVEDEGRAEQHRTLRTDLVLAELAGGGRLAVFSRDPRRREIYE